MSECPCCGKTVSEEYQMFQGQYLDIKIGRFSVAKVYLRAIQKDSALVSVDILEASAECKE